VIIFFSLCASNLGAELLQKDDSLSYESDDDEYNLVIASLKGDLGMVENLLEKGVNPNTVIDESITPLIYASQGGHSSICTILIARGADVNFRPPYGTTPLITSIKSQQSKIFDLLLSMGADINQGDELGCTPLMHAIALSDSSLFEKILNLKCNIQKTDTFGRNALMIAVINDQLYFTKQLLKRGLDVNSYDTKGVSPFMVAVSHANYPMMDLLIQYGADINHVSKQKHSALTIALEKQDEKLIQYLMDNGVDVNQKITSVETPLSVAKYFQSNIFIIEALESKGAKQTYWPDIRQFVAGIEFLGNFQHIMGGINVGVHDYRYDLELTGGGFIRFTPSRILDPMDQPNKYYQYWENRFLIYAGLDKNFKLKYIPNKSHQGILLGARWIYTGYTYRGTTIHNEMEQTWAARIGYYWSFWKVKIYGAYQYIDFGHKGVSPHSYNLGVNFYIGKSIHFDNKNYQPW
jgi:ankyrin repeat protein